MLLRSGPYSVVVVFLGWLRGEIPLCEINSFGTFCHVPDIPDCTEATCGGHGSCEDDVDGYICHCEDLYSGTNCEIGKQGVEYNRHLNLNTLSQNYSQIYVKPNVGHALSFKLLCCCTVYNFVDVSECCAFNSDLLVG